MDKSKLTISSYFGFCYISMDFLIIPFNTNVVFFLASFQVNKKHNITKLEML